MPGTTSIEILEVALPPRNHSQQTADQPDLPRTVGQDFDTRPMVPSGTQHGRGPHARGEQPGLPQVARLVLAQQSRLLGRVERCESRGRAQSRHPRGVLKLENLRRPLDIRQTAGTELEMACGCRTTRQPLGLHTRLEPADLPQPLPGEPLGTPAQGRHQLFEGACESGVTGAGPSPQQRLTLPHRRPPLVVLGIGVQCPTHGSVVALGA